MPAQQPSPTIQNHFQAGLKTEFTGLNFPENAATDTQNCVFTLTGDVNRRGGIDYEDNNEFQFIDQASVARSTFRWLNAGGDGESQILVQQIGSTLYFWLSSNATLGTPLSTTLLSTQISLLNFLSNPGSNPSQIECQYSSGNGYLFVFHPLCSSFYVTFFPGSNFLEAQSIELQIRDTVGILEPGVADTFRPTSLSNEHLYNLLNQGWTQGSGWTGASSLNSGGLPLSNVNSGGGLTLTLSSQSSASVLHSGDILVLTLSSCAGTGSNPHVNGSVTLIGTITSYTSPTVTLTITSNSNPALNCTGAWSGGNFSQFASPINLTLANQGFINSWFGVVNAYPSNSDIWWLYKDDTGVFNPTTTFGNVQPLNTPAPKGSFIYDAFFQDRSATSGVGGLTVVNTTARPSTGAFYAGRVFYAGVNASFPAQGDAQYYTWTENVYFSQIIESPSNFGRCYQTNDPTSQDFFSLLPSDGGVVQIQGCGNIYKLFPLRFGLLVFAANGIWFIGGSTGIGFTANDFSVTKISSIQSIGSSSFIDVQGYPFFWNEEGIYQVTPSAQAGSAHSPDIQLDVQNLCLGTILTYYGNIPTISKVYSRGDYDQLNYIVQWVFRSVGESGINQRYSYDSILSYNVITKAFYPYTLPNTTSVIYDVKYIQNPGGSGRPDPILKYVTSISSAITFSEENDFENYVDFIDADGVGMNYTSYFVTGYQLPGQGLRKIQTPYIYMFSRNPGLNSYGIRAIWDYAGSAILGSADANSGKWSTRQIITNNQTDYTMIYRKIRLRGRGLAVQIRVDSQEGQPFDLMGWSIWNEVNAGI